MAVDPSGKYLYAAAYLGHVLQYAIGPGGVLTPLVPAYADPGIDAPRVDLALDTAGHYVYLVNHDNAQVARLQATSDGSLNARGTPLCSQGPCSIVLTGQWQ